MSKSKPSYDDVIEHIQEKIKEAEKQAATAIKTKDRKAGAATVAVLTELLNDLG